MRKIFVTGGTGGLGLAIVRRHLHLGDAVWAMYLRETEEMRELLK